MHPAAEALGADSSRSRESPIAGHAVHLWCQDSVGSAFLGRNVRTVQEEVLSHLLALQHSPDWPSRPV